MSITPWNDQTNIINEFDRVVKFEFETSQGPGHVTLEIRKGTGIGKARQELLSQLTAHYQSIELTKYEILDIS